MENTYTVCHSCQLSGGGIRHCAHPEECNGTTTYPTELRQMIESNYAKNIPLSIIAEMAYDMGKLTTKTDRRNILYENGIYFGFPKCCIREYSDDIIEKNYQRIEHRLSLVNGQRGRLGGFVPCMQHCIEISTELVKVEDLITNRVCPKPYKTID